MNAKMKKFFGVIRQIYWNDTPSKIIAIGTLINCSAMFDHSLAGYCRTWVGSAMIFTCCGFIIIRSRRRMAKFKACQKTEAVAKRHVEAILTLSPISTTIQIESRFEQMEAAIDTHTRAVNELAALYKPEGKK